MPSLNTNPKKISKKNKIKSILFDVICIFLFIAFLYFMNGYLFSYKLPTQVICEQFTTNDFNKSLYKPKGFFDGWFK